MHKSNSCLFQYTIDDWITNFKTGEKKGKPIYGILSIPFNVKKESPDNEKTVVVNIETITPLTEEQDSYNDQYIFSTYSKNNDIVGNLNIVCQSVNNRDLLSRQDVLQDDSKLCLITSSTGNFVTKQGIKTGDFIKFTTSSKKQRCWEKV